MKTYGRKTSKAGRTTSAPIAAKAPSAISAAALVTPTFDQIAKRSYELYLARGGESSTAQQLADWLTAEAELRGDLGRAS